MLTPALTPEARLYLAAVDALNRQDWAAALAMARQLLAQAPQLAQLHHIAAVAARHLGQQGACLSHARQATTLDPSRGAYQVELAQALAQNFRGVEALAIAGAAEPRVRDDPAACHQLALVYAQLQAHDRAEPLASHAAALDPGRAAYLFNHATLLALQGQLQRAHEGYEATLAREPRHGQAYLGLAQLEDRQNAGARIDRLRRLLADCSDVYLRMQLQMALGKELEQAGEYPTAFAAMVEGKALGRSLRAHDDADEAALFDSLMAPKLANAQMSATPAAGPIFVIGMPRSGTTLVETILAAHPRVRSGGELTQFPVLFRRASGVGGRELISAEIVAAGTRTDPRRLGQAYVEATGHLTAAHERFIDKLPHNFLYLPWILRALPQTRVVCLRRDALETCLGNFRQLFAPESPFHGYSFDLPAIVRHVVRFQRLLAHWQTVFTERLLVLDYEALVDAQEEQTRRLLAFCGLDWDPACLDFHRTSSAVTSASAVQIRAGLHAGGKQRSWRYAAELEPVRRMLAEHGACAGV